MPLDVFFKANPVLQSLVARDAVRERHRENASRHAYCYADFSTHGQGELIHPTVITFDVTFIEEPRIATGWDMDGDTLVEGSYPMVSAGIWKWQIDKRGFYLGAWPVIKIIGHDSYDIDHHYTFSGIAMKDLPAHLLDS